MMGKACVSVCASLSLQPFIVFRKRETLWNSQSEHVTISHNQWPGSSPEIWARQAAAWARQEGNRDGQPITALLNSEEEQRDETTNQSTSRFAPAMREEKSRRSANQSASWRSLSQWEQGDESRWTTNHSTSRFPPSNHRLSLGSCLATCACERMKPRRSTNQSASQNSSSQWERRDLDLGLGLV